MRLKYRHVAYYFIGKKINRPVEHSIIFEQLQCQEIALSFEKSTRIDSDERHCPRRFYVPGSAHDGAKGYSWINQGTKQQPNLAQINQFCFKVTDLSLLIGKENVTVKDEHNFADSRKQWPFDHKKQKQQKQKLKQYEIKTKDGVAVLLGEETKHELKPKKKFKHLSKPKRYINYFIKESKSFARNSNIKNVQVLFKKRCLCKKLIVGWHY